MNRYLIRSILLFYDTNIAAPGWLELGGRSIVGKRYVLGSSESFVKSQKSA